MKELKITNRDIRNRIERKFKGKSYECCILCNSKDLVITFTGKMQENLMKACTDDEDGISLMAMIDVDKLGDLAIVKDRDSVNTLLSYIYGFNIIGATIVNPIDRETFKDNVVPEVLKQVFIEIILPDDVENSILI